MRKIVLFNPPFFQPPLPMAPLSVMAAGSILDLNGYKVEIINGTTEPNYTERVIKECADAICLGISSMTGYQIRGGINVSSAVRKKYPSLPIIWGGWHGSILPRETALDSAVDAVVIGQGERTFTELVQALENGDRELGKIKGLTYKKGKEVLVNEVRPFEDVNHFPPMPYHLVNLEEILKYRAQTVQGRILEYASSQGCPNDCRFCVEPLVMSRRWSGLAARRVIDEWEFLFKKYKLSSIGLVDSNFFVDRHRVEAVCSGIVKLRLPITWYNANATVDTLVSYDRQMWELLAQSGCRSILVGAESGSKDMLRLVDKKCTIEDILKIAKVSRQNGIRVSFSFMTGFPPGDDREGIKKEFKATMRLIYKILRINKNHDIKLFLYTPYPGSPLYSKSLEHGLQVPKDLSAWGNFELVNITTPWISRRFKEKVDLAWMFAIPYFQKGYTLKKGWKNFLRYLLTLTSGWRLKYGMFALPFEYRFLYRRWKAKGLVWGAENSLKNE